VGILNTFASKYLAEAASARLRILKPRRQSGLPQIALRVPLPGRKEVNMLFQLAAEFLSRVLRYILAAKLTRCELHAG